METTGSTGDTFGGKPNAFFLEEEPSRIGFHQRAAVSPQLGPQENLIFGVSSAEGQHPAKAASKAVVIAWTVHCHIAAGKVGSSLDLSSLMRLLRGACASSVAATWLARP